MSRINKLSAILPAVAAIVIIVVFAVSGHITKSNDEKSPTALTTVAEASAENNTEAEGSSVTLTAVGNNIIDAALIDACKTEGSYDFNSAYAKIAPEIGKADIASINQMSVFSKDEPSGYPLYSTPVQLADACINAGFDVFTCATDHILDKGTSAITDHIEYIESKNAVATGINSNENDLITYYKKNGITFAFLNYSFSSGSTSLSMDNEFYLNLFSKERITKDVKEAKKNADVIIAYTYWSNTATAEITEFQQKYAQLLADLKVDLVIGYAPSVLPVKELESKDKKHKTIVFYSLGNFMSHQIDSEELIGAMANIKFAKHGDKVEISKARLVPIVTYYDKTDDGQYIFEVMKLTDYTKEMATQSTQSFSTPAEYEAYIEKIVPADYLSLK